jgi:hypothetical protein
VIRVEIEPRIVDQNLTGPVLPISEDRSYLTWMYVIRMGQMKDDRVARTAAQKFYSPVT